MPRSDTYNTKQKEKIIEIIKNKEKAFTIKEIHEEIKEKTGLTTIYRLMSKMAEEEKIQKYIAKDNKTYYQYLKDCNKENHFYLKCNKCGNMTHIDCECIGKLYSHILNNHKFKLSKKNIIITGICNKCLGEKI